jgi:hypothetical protein
LTLVVRKSNLVWHRILNRHETLTIQEEP